MKSLLMLLVLASYALGLSSLLRQRFERTLPTAVLLIIAVLYAFGILGALAAGVVFVLALAAVSLLYAIWQAFRRPQALALAVATPGTVLFLLLFAVLCAGHTGRLVSGWDEFSHWGLVVKNMVALDSLGYHPASTVLFAGYPPGISLFQYLWIKLGPGFTEADLYRAYGVFMVAMLLPCLAQSEWRRPGAALLMLSLLLMTPILAEPAAYTTLYVDPLLGVAFAHILLVSFQEDRSSAWRTLDLSLSVFVLALIKTSGVGLAAIALVILIIDALFRLRRDRSRSAPVRALAPLGCMLAALLAAKLSWDLTLSLTQTSQAWPTDRLSLSALRDYLGGAAPAYQYATTDYFVSALFQRPLLQGLLGVSFAACLALAALWAWLPGRLYPADGRSTRHRALSLGLVLGGVLYALSLWALYAFTFFTDEAVGLASFARYMGTYVVGACGAALLLFAQAATAQAPPDDPEPSPGARRPIAAGLLLASVFFLVSPEPLLDVTVRAQASVQKTQDSRAMLAPVARLQGVVPQDAALYFVMQGSTGYEYYSTKYLLAPTRFNPINTWHLGPPSSDAVASLAYDITPEAWQNLLAGYDYVYLGFVDEPFAERFGHLFAGGLQPYDSSLLYRVEQAEGGVQLVYIPL